MSDEKKKDTYVTETVTESHYLRIPWTNRCIYQSHTIVGKTDEGNWEDKQWNFNKPCDLSKIPEKDRSKEPIAFYYHYKHHNTVKVTGAIK